MKKWLSLIWVSCYLLACIGQVEHVHVCTSEMSAETTINETASCCDSEEIAAAPSDEESDGCCSNHSQYKKLFAGKVQAGQEVQLCALAICPNLQIELAPNTFSYYQLRNNEVSLPLPHAPPPRGVPLYKLWQQWKFDVLRG